MRASTTFAESSETAAFRLNDAPRSVAPELIVMYDCATIVPTCKTELCVEGPHRLVLVVPHSIRVDVHLQITPQCPKYI